MSTFWDNVKDIIDSIEPLLLVIIPACFGIYLKLKTKIDAEKEKQVRQNDEKNRKEMKNWEHTESVNVVRDVRAICNFYRDVGHMDLVSFIQLENGTVATSKLCNMFVTCLAEDSRSSVMQKISSCIQRVPYSRLIDLVDTAKDEVVIKYNFNADKADDEYNGIVSVIPSFECVNSYVIAPVKDSQGYLIGYCLFLYVSDISNDEKERYIRLINRFVAGVEAIFLRYNKNRNNKKKELNLD